MTDVSVTLRPPCWCPSAWAPTWRLHTKLYKFGWNTFPNNARMNYRTDLNLGEVVYISSSFISQFFYLIYWMVTIFIFNGVTLQTSHRILNVCTNTILGNHIIDYRQKECLIKFRLYLCRDLGCTLPASLWSSFMYKSPFLVLSLRCFNISWFCLRFEPLCMFLTAEKVHVHFHWDELYLSFLEVFYGNLWASQCICGKERAGKRKKTKGMQFLNLGMP